MAHLVAQAQSLGGALVFARNIFLTCIDPAFPPTPLPEPPPPQQTAATTKTKTVVPPATKTIATTIGAAQATATQAASSSEVVQLDWR